MLFNCFQCGKTISSKKSSCVYCKTDNSSFALEFGKERLHETIKDGIKEKYYGTLLSFLLKAKPTK